MDKYLDPATGRVCTLTGRTTLAHVEVVEMYCVVRVDGEREEIQGEDRWWVRQNTLELITDES